MNLQNFTKLKLVENLQFLVKEERRITVEILWHLKEIERIKVFAEYGYSSIYEFTTKNLGYSEGAAYRRINAMQILKEQPQIAEKIKDGRLSVTNLAKAQTLFRKKKLDKIEKLDLLKTLENKSSKQADLEILKIDPKFGKEQTRQLSEETLEIKMHLNLEEQRWLEELKAFYSHQNPSCNNQDLIRLLIKKQHEAIAEKCTIKKSIHFLDDKYAVEKLNQINSEKLAEVGPQQIIGTKHERVATPLAKSEKLKSLTKSQKFTLNKTCSYQDSKTGKKCESNYFLEVDHIQPKAKGGTNTTDNLRPLCRTHNQLAAIKHYGLGKMQPYWSAN